MNTPSRLLSRASKLSTRNTAPSHLRQFQTTPSRQYAIQSPGAPAVEVFSSRTKWQHKERAAANIEQSRKVDYLRDEVAARLCDRLLDINRSFPKALDFGANACNIARIPPEALRRSVLLPSHACMYTP